MKTIKLKKHEIAPSNFTGIIESENGNKYWYKNDKLHRIDGPAVEYLGGTKEWWIEDKLHRVDGPAIEYSSGHKEWWINKSVYNVYYLEYLFETAIYLRKEKGKYDLYWFKFLTETGIEEFAVIPGMEIDQEYNELFFKIDQLAGATSI